jgi:glutathione S-transferase
VPKIRRLTGATEVPVLREGERVIAGSARIVEHLEETFPEPRLYPADPALRQRALEIQRRFDEEVGPAIRLAMFFEVMDADFAVGAFASGRGPLTRGTYRLAFAPVSRVMQARMHIDADNAARGRERTREALDFVVEQAGPDGSLVGDRFSVADLACAALLMPAVSVAEWGGPVLPETPKVARWLARWSEHPGAAWVRRTYAAHRRAGGA